jgi:sec-independent protein translocase protein TatC
MNRSSPPDADELAGTEQPFVAHLIELRQRLIRALSAVFICFAILFWGWPGAGALYDWLAAPLTTHMVAGTIKPTMIATNVLSPFLVPLKITLLTAFLMALPVVLYQVWAFIAPGLYNHEKKLVLPLVISSTALFFIGIAFCYYFVLGQVFVFIQKMAPKSISPMPDIEAYLSFVMTLFIAFGAAFEVPVVVVVLASVGIVSIEKLKSFRRYFVVVAFVISAVITPPDVVSQLALAIPMCLLYELGIWCAQFFIRHARDPEADSSEPVPPASS